MVTPDGKAPLPGDVPKQRRISSSWPTRMTSIPKSRAAATAPATISPGARSPPMASMAIRIFWSLDFGLGALDQDPSPKTVRLLFRSLSAAVTDGQHLAAIVIAAFGAGAVR